MAGTNAYLTIGEFGRQARLSGKALRLYDSLGLLVPARVDPGNGYRLYALDQLARARRIVLLRGLGMSLATIAELIDLPDADLYDGVRAWWRHEEHQHESRRSLLAYLQNVLTEGTTTMYEIQTRDVPEQKVLTLQRRVLVDALGGFFDEMPGLLKHLESSGAELTGPAMAIYHGPVNEEADGPVELCLPFIGTVEPLGEYAIRIEPAHREAYTRITKAQVAFPKILEAYDAVQHWLNENGHQMNASPREIYFADWATVGDDEPAADITYPFS
jgi:DNA-binding transcriptional MerR regulator